jgi:hypothetical protein
MAHRGWESVYPRPLSSSSSSLPGLTYYVSEFVSNTLIARARTSYLSLARTARELAIDSERFFKNYWETPITRKKERGYKCCENLDKKLSL